MSVRSTRLARPTAIAVAALIALGATGCDGVSSDPTARFGGTSTSPSGTSAESESANTTTPPTGSSAVAAPDLTVDYRHLLVKAENLSDHEDTFTARQIDMNPRGVPGASAFFVNADDNRAITDTLVIYPDPATATATLEQARANLDTKVVGGTPTPAPVGTDGVVVSGTSPEGDRAVTALMFTEGRALVRLEFESAVGDATTDQFVTTVGKMQLAALQSGLTEAE